MKIKTVNCPTCKQEVHWERGSTFKPFCSERCKLIDLGEWASERHAIVGEKVYSPEDDPLSEH